MATSSNGIIQLLNEITDFDHGFHPEFVEIVDSQDLRGIRAPHYHKNNFGKLANDIKFNKFMRDTWTKNPDLQKLDRRKIEALWFKTPEVSEGLRRPKEIQPKERNDPGVVASAYSRWGNLAGKYIPLVLLPGFAHTNCSIYDHTTHKFWEEKCHAAGAQMSYPNPDDENNPFADQRWARLSFHAWITDLPPSDYFTPEEIDAAAKYDSDLLETEDEDMDDDDEVEMDISEDADMEMEDAVAVAGASTSGTEVLALRFR